jgi:hypothetical protein
MGYRLGFDSQQVQDFSLLHNVQTSSGTYASYNPIGPGVSFPRGKADHSPPTTAEVRNDAGIPTHPHTSSWWGA